MSNQTTLINNTSYEISGGRTLVNNTGYDIQNGRTLIDGVGYDILFDEEEHVIPYAPDLTKKYTVKTDYLEKLTIPNMGDYDAYGFIKDGNWMAAVKYYSSDNIQLNFFAKGTTSYSLDLSKTFNITDSVMRILDSKEIVFNNDMIFIVGHLVSAGNGLITKHLIVIKINDDMSYLIYEPVVIMDGNQAKLINPLPRQLDETHFAYLRGKIGVSSGGYVSYFLAVNGRLTLDGNRNIIDEHSVIISADSYTVNYNNLNSSPYKCQVLSDKYIYYEYWRKVDTTKYSNAYDPRFVIIDYSNTYSPRIVRVHDLTTAHGISDSSQGKSKIYYISNDANVVVIYHPYNKYYCAVKLNNSNSDEDYYNSNVILSQGFEYGTLTKIADNIFFYSDGLYNIWENTPTGFISDQKSSDVNLYKFTGTRNYMYYFNSEDNYKPYLIYTSNDIWPTGNYKLYSSILDGTEITNRVNTITKNYRDEYDVALGHFRRCYIHGVSNPDGYFYSINAGNTIYHPYFVRYLEQSGDLGALQKINNKIFSIPFGGGTVRIFTLPEVTLRSDENSFQGYDYRNPDLYTRTIDFQDYQDSENILNYNIQIPYLQRMGLSGNRELTITSDMGELYIYDNTKESASGYITLYEYIPPIPPSSISTWEPTKFVNQYSGGEYKYYTYRDLKKEYYTQQSTGSQVIKELEIVHNPSEDFYGDAHIKNRCKIFGIRKALYDNNPPTSLDWKYLYTDYGVNVMGFELSDDKDVDSIDGDLPFYNNEGLYKQFFRSYHKIAKKNIYNKPYFIQETPPYLTAYKDLAFESYIVFEICTSSFESQKDYIMVQFYLPPYNEAENGHYMLGSHYGYYGGNTIDYKY